MTPDERWTDHRNDALDRLDPPDLEHPVECVTCAGEGWVQNPDMFADTPWQACPRCKGRGAVAA